jgi:5-formyltetrahydrofolate cyclo-ligase
MLAARRALSHDEQRMAGKLIQDSFMASSEYAAAGSVALYVATHAEVPTLEVLRGALSAGKTVILPSVAADGLVFREIRSEADLCKGRFNIPEPAATCKSRHPANIDIFVIPGVAFDHYGRRLGYGKGYYDKTLHILEGSGRLFGFCYDFQLVDSIAAEPHDVIMDRVITERRVLTPVLLK